MNLTAIYFLLATVFTAWIYYPLSNANVFTAQPSNVLLLTAHPDDECMFFSPTLLALTRTGSTLFSLCLSAGDQDGLGATRAEELEGSLNVLGIPQTHRQLVNHKLLQDNISVTWDARVIADVVEPFVQKNKITTILTFDTTGVSGHPNHISLPLGVQMLATKTPSLQLFTLISVPLATKYIGFLSTLLSRITITLRGLFGSFEGLIVSAMVKYDLISTQTQTRMAAAHLKEPIFVAGLPDYIRGIQAMRKHQTQLVWFRYLYVLFSRYMWVNELKEVPLYGKV